MPALLAYENIWKLHRVIDGEEPFPHQRKVLLYKMADVEERFQYYYYGTNTAIRTYITTFRTPCGVPSGIVYRTSNYDTRMLPFQVLQHIREAINAVDYGNGEFGNSADCSQLYCRHINRSVAQESRISEYFEESLEYSTRPCAIIITN